MSEFQTVSEFELQSVEGGLLGFTLEKEVYEAMAVGFLVGGIVGATYYGLKTIDQLS